MGKGRKTSTTSSDTPPDEADAGWRGRRVQVALDEIAASAHEGLLAVAVGAGLQVMHALMEDDVTAVCGPKGRPRGVAGDRGARGGRGSGDRVGAPDAEDVGSCLHATPGVEEPVVS